ncbi:FN1 [Branchiostoma lanceolatum]|uniref:FN1 protein n=1 Tax=Branchiostoma lanceolatum TaxID=7740 RepID=A0A8K0EUH7_BRALA|nr:FN1 [Branchiostoma lanceolatum]
MFDSGLLFTLVLASSCVGLGQGNHAFEVLRTANQQFRGANFLAINAKLPADGLSATSNWCRDYQNLCAEFGLRPTGCGERGLTSIRLRCMIDYNSNRYINNALDCNPAVGVAEVANLAFSAGATWSRSFGFFICGTNCKHNSGCAQIRNNLPGGDYNCSCRPGFVLMEDGHGCEEDECAANNGGCAHNCAKVPGTYICSCRPGFALTEDGHGCEECGHCQGGDVNCDPVSGACSAGCQDGWKTQICKESVDPPVNLNVTDITDEGFKVTWSPSPDPDLQAYRVVVSEWNITTAVNQTTDQTWLQVVGLAPETDYIMRVTVLVLSDGRRSQSNVTTTEATTIMSSSTDLEFVNVTDTTSKLRFTWVPPDTVVTGYRIMYGQEEATEQLIPSQGPGERSALLEGLQPDTMYKVEIITIGVRQESLPLIGRNATEPDECATVNGRCDHMCSNIPGGYRCQCLQGFKLMADAHGCGGKTSCCSLLHSDKCYTQCEYAIISYSIHHLQFMIYQADYSHNWHLEGNYLDQITLFCMAVM